MSNNRNDEPSGTRFRRALPVVPPAAPLSRHPRDGWKRARPFPMGKGARRAFYGVLRAVCPERPVMLTAKLERKVERNVRLLMAYMPRPVARGMWFSLFVLDWAPRLLLVSPKRLQRMDPEHAAKVLRRLARCRFRFVKTALVGIRGLILSAYFDQDEVHRALGYAPVPFMTERLERRRALLDARRARAG